MTRAGLALALLAAVAACAGETRREPIEPEVSDGAVPASPSPSAEPPSPGRPAVEPKPETIAAARAALSTADRSPAEQACGPYRALSSAPARYLEICRLLAEDLDATYQDRFGVAVSNPNAGLILVFGSAEEYRKFAADFGRLRAGYAGFTMASRGVVAVLAEDTPIDRFATVLGHEMAHLVHRRVFGFNLAPWLSEGLADALGDTATPTGFGELKGIEGVEPLAARLQLAIDSGRAESIAVVVTKPRSEFDQGVVSYDYETSALLVRFLLLDPTLAPRFREALGSLASPQKCDAACLFETLEVTEPDLDLRFRRWLAAMV